MTAQLVVSHPTMNTNVRNLLIALDQIGALAEFHTSIDATRHLSLLRAVSPGTPWERRTLPSSVSLRTISHPAHESLGFAARSVPALSSFVSLPSVHGLYRYIDKKAATALTVGHSAALAYEDGALQTFLRAKSFGLRAYYDLPIPFWRKKHDILREEAASNPEWAQLLGGLEDSSSVLDRKSAELELADAVLTASTLSTASVAEVFPGKEVLQVPYGGPEPAAAPIFRDGGPLRVLFVGSLTQRKGLSYLFNACAELGREVSLSVVGRAPRSVPKVLSDALQGVRHVSTLPHDGILESMRQHDVLVLPSLVEGFGLVINEALSQGIPVVTTPNTGAADTFAGPSRKWIVPVADSAAIAARLAAWSADRDSLNQAKLHALDLARVNAWASYRDAVARLVLADSRRHS